MEVSIKKWGNSLGIRIPQNILTKLKIKESQKLDIHIENSSIVIKPITDELELLLGQITPKNLHTEYDFGSPQGDEIW